MRLLSIILLVLLSSSAFAKKLDPIDDFRNHFALALEDISIHGIQFDHSKYSIADLENASTTVEVSKTKNKLMLDGHQKAAINYQMGERFYIQLNEKRWRQIDSPLIKKAIALHEYAELLGLENEEYSLSGLYLAYLTITSQAQIASGNLCFDNYQMWRSLAIRRTHLKQIGLSVVAGVLTIPFWSIHFVIAGMAIAFEGAFVAASSLNVSLPTKLYKGIDLVNWAYYRKGKTAPKELYSIYKELYAEKFFGESQQIIRHNVRKKNDLDIVNHLKSAIRLGVESGEFCKNEQPANSKEIKKYIKQLLLR